MDIDRAALMQVFLSDSEEELAMTNVERLVSEGIIVDTYLTAAGRDRINAIDLTNEDIAALKSIKEKLNLDPLQLADLGSKSDVGLWQL